LAGAGAVAEQGGFRFEPEWRITLFTVLMAPLLLGLGFWQLQRADEKAILAATFDARAAQAPATLASLAGRSPEELAYLPVQLAGSFLPDAYFLLDNRVREGQFGYEVLGIVALDNGGAALVNRGWVPGDASRRELPLVPEVAGPVELAGHIYVAPGKPYLLGEQAIDPGWPKRIQAVEMERLRGAVEDLVAGPLFPYPVRIDAGQPGALRADWQIINVSPAKHLGYAVQWFSMAAVLVLIYVYRNSNIGELLRGRRQAED